MPTKLDATHDIRHSTMVRATRKRKAVDYDDYYDTSSASSSMSRAGSIESTRQDNKGKKKRKKTKTVACHNSDIEEVHPAFIFKTPRNPRATFEGLPTELRLQVYDYLRDLLHIHVHRRVKTREEASSQVIKPPFVWDPCRQTNPKTRLLCANPEWSGMCKEEDRCSYKADSPAEPRGPWALIASNKAIRNEAKELFLRETVLSVNSQDLQPWLNHLIRYAPQRIKHLRHITLTGLNEWDSTYTGLVQLLQECVPNLAGLGFQFYTHGCPSINIHEVSQHSIRIEQKQCRNWLVANMLSRFESPIAFALEATIWHKTGPSKRLAIRMISQDSEDGEDEADVYVDIDDPGKWAETGQQVEWRKSWRKENYERGLGSVV